MFAIQCKIIDPWDSQIGLRSARATVTRARVVQRCKKPLANALTRSPINDLRSWTGHRCSDSESEPWWTRSTQSESDPVCLTHRTAGDNGSACVRIWAGLAFECEKGGVPPQVKHLSACMDAGACTVNALLCCFLMFG